MCKVGRHNAACGRTIKALENRPDGQVQENRLLTEINDLYRILEALKQTYTMVRNSTKLILACIVLGVVNQACAVGSAGKASANEVRPANPARNSDLLAGQPQSGVPEPVTLRTDVLKASPAAAPAPVQGVKPPAPELAAPQPQGTPTVSGYEAPLKAPSDKPSLAAPKNPIVLAQAAAAPRPAATAPRAAAEPATLPTPTRLSSIVAAAPLATPTRADLPTTMPPSATSLAAALTAAPPKSADMPPQDPTATAIRPSATAKPTDPLALPASNGTAGEPAVVANSGVAPVASTTMTSTQAVYSDTPAEIVPGNLWVRIRMGYAIAEVESPLVQRHMTWYLNRPEYLERMVERGRRYLHYIVEELERRHMPLEIALLPMIESAYNPVAYSRAHASGIWQFIPATGKHYGLEQNWWYDGRRDVTAATGAALDYLQKLHDDFGDWQLALAAYNWGEGAVGRAIAKNQRARKPTDYRSLKMPKETANYLPKLQAVKNIIADPERYGILLVEIPDQPYFIRVNAPSHIDVKRAAQLAEVPLEEFRNLNPAHNRPVISSDGERTLLVPVDKAETFASNLEANDDPLVSWQTYQLKPNDKLEQVAARYGITVATLKQVNGIGTRKKVRSGQMLLVPTPAAMQHAKLEHTLDPFEFQPPMAGPDMETYRVKRSDTLQRIANHYQVTTRQIVKWNHLKGGRIAVGQQLTIYPDTAPTAKRASHGKSAKQSEPAKPKAKKTSAAATPGKKQLARN